MACRSNIILIMVCSLFTALTAATSITDIAGSGKAKVMGWRAYEAGQLGAHPSKTLFSSSSTSPLIHVLQQHKDLESDGYVFLSPQADDIHGHYAYMLDLKGRLIWHHEEWGVIKNIQVQRYQGHKYITFWTGDDGFWGHGSGFYKMV